MTGEEEEEEKKKTIAGGGWRDGSVGGWGVVVWVGWWVGRCDDVGDHFFSFSFYHHHSSNHSMTFSVSHGYDYLLGLV